MSFSFFSKNKFLRCSIISLLFFPVSVFAGVQEETSKGDIAFKSGKMEEAEANYSSALKMDPGSWRIMRGLAETKFRLKKYRETKDLVDRIRAMKVIKRNIVVVTLSDSSETFEAEIVDETGSTIQSDTKDITIIPQSLNNIFQVSNLDAVFLQSISLINNIPKTIHHPPEPKSRNRSLPTHGSERFCS